MRTSCIRLRAKSRIAVLYEDFLEICSGNMLAAMLLAILVYWTDVKISKKDSNLWIWKSHTDFQEDLMFDKPGMKPPHRVTIKAALDLLVEKKFVYRRKNPKMALDQTKQYFIDTEAIQSAIDALPSIVEKVTLESRNHDNGMSENEQSLSKNRQCNVEIPTSNTSDYSTVITDSEITDSEGANSAAHDALTPARAALSSLKKAVDEALEDTAKRAAVRAPKGDAKDAAVHGARDRGGVDSATGQVGGGDGAVRAVPAVSDCPDPAAVSAVLAVRPGEALAPAHAVRGATGPSQSSGGATHPQAGTAAVLPRNGTASESRAPGGRSHTPARPKMERPQLTLEGNQVKGWLEDIWGVTISQRAGNVKDLNDLGALCDVSRDSLDTTITFLEAKKWVKEHDVAITLHILSGNDTKFSFLSFENNWQSARRRKPARHNDTLADGKTSVQYAI